MNLTTAEKIKIILKRRNLTITELAEKLNQSRQNLSNKLSRNDFRESELARIAEALNCDYDTIFIMRDTGEKI